MINTGQREVLNAELSDRYVNNKLDEADRAAFEIQMMEDADLFQEVQMLDALKQNLVNAPEILTASTSAVILPFRGWLRQPMSIAASLLVAVLGINALTQGDLGALQRNDSLPIGSVVLLEGNRGSTSTTFTGSPPYLFQIDVGFGNQAADFNVALHNIGDNAAVMQLDGLQADPDGWVRMVLNTPLSGDYEAELAWTDETGAAQVRRFPISISP